jgi:fructose-1,6-bisphosphatase II
VRYTGIGADTASIVMRSRSGTTRRVEATHRWGKLEEIAGERYRK